MKAIVNKAYGTPDMLEFKDVVKPVPAENEVLVKIHAASINISDWFLLTGKPFLIRLMGEGFLKPKNTILGADIAGRVEAVGSRVTQFKPGDEVFGDTSSHGRGGFAEYVAAPETTLVLKPSNITFEQAAAVPLSAVTALQGLRIPGQVQPGQKVLINGASGGVGGFALQIAIAFGADVTAVVSTRNVEMARSAGARHVIDYTREDFTQNGQHYDWIIAVNGYHPIGDYKRVLTPEGTYVCLGGTLPQIFQSILLGGWMSRKGGKKLVNVAAHSDQDDLAFVANMLEAGKINPVIDRCYPLSETAEALRYFSQGHNTGKIIIGVV